MILATIFAATAVLASQTVAPPYAQRALNQNELLFNDSVAIVDVNDPSLLSESRSVETRSGTIATTFWTQRATVVSGQGTSGSPLKLVFQDNPWLPSDRETTAQLPDALTLPLGSGRYIVLGRKAVEGRLVSFSPLAGLGFEDKTYKPSVFVLKAEAKTPEELAVFAIFPTKLSQLPSGTTDSLPLVALASAIDENSDKSVVQITRLLVHTNHQAFPEWKAGALQAAQ